MQNIASRWGRVISLGTATTGDYTLVVPIFGDPRYFRNGEYLRQYRDNVLLAVNVDSAKMERFVEELRADGWRVHASRLTGRVSCPEIVFDALRSVSTGYVIRIDGDTVSRDDPGRVVAAVRDAGADLCSVKVTVSRRVALTACVVWLLWIAKWHELVDVGHIAAILPFIILLCTGVSFLSNWSVRSPWMIIYPYYALFQALVLPPVGAVYYLWLWFRRGTVQPRVGIESASAVAGSTRRSGCRTSARPPTRTSKPIAR